MEIEGGCYCGAVRYRAEGKPFFRALCHCRECQYFSGGGPNAFMGMPESGLVFTRGTPKAFERSDLESPVRRVFCPDCGTHLTSRVPSIPDALFLKVGTFDDPSLYGSPQMAIYTIDRQAFHLLPPGVKTFERLPG